MSEPEHFADPKALASELRDKVGLSMGYASDLANNNRTPSLKTAARIEEKLGIPPAAWTRRPDKQAAA